MNIDQRIRAELADLESRAQIRQLEAPRPADRDADFSSNDYLGLAVDPRMKQAIREALESTPRVASTGSRLLSGHDEAWDALEEDFARWVGAEAALFFTSGYAANIGLLTTVLREGDVVFSDEANHASLIDGMRLAKGRRVVFPHLDLDALENELRRCTSLSRDSEHSGARFIVVESIFSMDGDRAPLGNLAALATRYGAELIVDEAHATGVYGPRGAGCVAKAGLADHLFSTVHTCGKALAGAGAFVCGSKALRRLLINRARTFIFNTALPPYLAAQVDAGTRLAANAEAERSHLANLSHFLRDALRSKGFDLARSDSHIVPIVLGSNDAALDFAAHLKTRGYAVRAIRPPTVAPGTSRLRLSLTARLSQEVLTDLVAATVQVRDELSSASATHASR